jgi:hypothetical protein
MANSYQLNQMAGVVPLTQIKFIHIALRHFHRRFLNIQTLVSLLKISGELFV